MSLRSEWSEWWVALHDDQKRGIKNLFLVCTGILIFGIGLGFILGVTWEGNR